MRQQKWHAKKLSRLPQTCVWEELYLASWWIKCPTKRESLEFQSFWQSKYNSKAFTMRKILIFWFTIYITEKRIWYFFSHFVSTIPLLWHCGPRRKEQLCVRNYIWSTAATCEQEFQRVGIVFTSVFEYRWPEICLEYYGVGDPQGFPGNAIPIFGKVISSCCLCWGVFWGQIQMTEACRQNWHASSGL